jgi:hypothetical protein
MSKGIVMMQDPSIRPKFRSSLTNSLTLHLPVFPNSNAGSLFDLVQETRSEQFSYVRWVFGRPVLSSSFTSSRPTSNLLCHSKTLDLFIASAPQASVNICRVSLALLPNFAQNLMLMRCSNNHHSFFRRDENTRLCNNHRFATTTLFAHQYTRRNHRHVVTRLCLVTAHSILDATYMRLFQELNCQTSYVTTISCAVRVTSWSEVQRQYSHVSDVDMGARNAYFSLQFSFYLFHILSVPPRCFSSRGILNRVDDVKSRGAMLIDTTRLLSHEF